MRLHAFWGVTVAVSLAAAGCGGGGGGTKGLGGAADFTISDASSANVTLAPPATMVVVGYEGAQIGVLGYGPPENGFMAKLWQVVIGFGSTVASGQTFTIVPSTAPGADPATLATVSVEDETPGGFREWVAGGGNVQILSRTGDTVIVNLNAKDFQPSTGGSGNAAMGSFSLSGTITVDDVNQALPTD